MKLPVMRFAGTAFHHNPKTLTMEYKKQLAASSLISGRTVLQRTTDTPTVISGTGELYGSSCFEQWNTLLSRYAAQTRGVLTIPEAGAYIAVLSQLKLIAQPAENLLTFSFTFTVMDNPHEAQPVSTEEYTTAESDESLWDIAYRTEVPIDELTALNPWVKSVWSIDEGAQVRIK